MTLLYLMVVAYSWAREIKEYMYFIIKNRKNTDPEHKATQKFSVLLAFPVITCVLALPSHVTEPPSS